MYAPINNLIISPYFNTPLYCSPPFGPRMTGLNEWYIYESLVRKHCNKPFCLFSFQDWIANLQYQTYMLGIVSLSEQQLGGYRERASAVLFTWSKPRSRVVSPFINRKGSYMSDEDTKKSPIICEQCRTAAIKEVEYVIGIHFK